MTAAPVLDRSSGLEHGTSELHRLEVGMLAAGLAAFGLLYCTQPLLPQIGATFRVGPATASLAVAVTTGAVALAVLPMSSLAETLGRARTMIGSLVAGCLLDVAAAGAQQYWQLLLARGLVGVALAGVLAVAMGHVGDEVAPTAVGGAMGVYVAGTTIGGLTGRLVPAGLGDLGGWRVAVIVFAGLAGIAAAVFAVLMPEPQRFTPMPWQLRAHLGAVGGHLRDPGIVRLAAVALLMMGGFVGTVNYLTYRLEAAPFRLPASAIGLVFLAYLAGTVSSAVAGRLADRVGRWRTLLGGASTAVTGVLITVPNTLWAVVPGLVIMTAGYFAVHSVASGWVTRRARAHRSQASALYVTCYYAGSSIGGSVIGLAWSAGGWAATATAVTCCYLAAGFIAPRT